MNERPGKKMSRVGVISDTHGLLRPEALQKLEGSDLIVHAGDVGPGDIIERLEEVAATVAIRGNVDEGKPSGNHPPTRSLEVAGKRIYLLHNLKELDFDPAAEGIDVIIAGHSHQPLIREDHGVLYLNPGSAGPRRFKLPITVANLEIEGDKLRARIQPLEPGPPS